MLTYKGLLPRLVLVITAIVTWAKKKKEKKKARTHFYVLKKAKALFSFLNSLYTRPVSYHFDNISLFFSYQHFFFFHLQLKRQKAELWKYKLCSKASPMVTTLTITKHRQKASWYQRLSSFPSLITKKTFFFLLSFEISFRLLCSILHMSSCECKKTSTIPQPSNLPCSRYQSEPWCHSKIFWPVWFEKSTALCLNNCHFISSLFCRSNFQEI